MKLTIIGTGASGWMAAAFLKNRTDIDSITIIGSSSIPTIGVGESTTGRFDDFLETLNINPSEFIRESDAAIKYGVYYSGWSPKDFFHSLKSQLPYYRRGLDYNLYGRLLGKKDPNMWLHDFIDTETWKMITKNHVSIQADYVENRMRYQHEPFPNPPAEYVNTWQFEANKFIEFMKNLCLKDPKINFLDAKVVDCTYVNENISAIILDDGSKIESDYWVISTGETKFNELVFNAKYESLDNILLTDKALFYPLPYTDKRNQIHPYTTAKTMKYGWRWITPTYSRIGTGYAFSSKHVSEDEAINEFITDIGDSSITPFVVDFHPRRIVNPFKSNHVFIGMASGFVEPLDAPGLDMAVNFLTKLNEWFNIPEDSRAQHIDQLNVNAKITHQWWSSFILCQYKTCNRNDTTFWKDQKSVSCVWYEDLMNNLDDLGKIIQNTHMMFYSTIAGKDIRWEVGADLTNIDLLPIYEQPLETIHHLDWLESMRSI